MERTITNTDELTTALRTGVVIEQLLEAGAQGVNVYPEPGGFTALVSFRQCVTVTGHGPSAPAALEACYRQVQK